MTFSECLPYLLLGKEIRRPCWKKYESIWMSSGNCQSSWTPKDEILFNRPYATLYREDLEANDWEVV